MNNTVLFDMDNTLVFSDRANFLAYHSAVAEVLGAKCARTLKADKRFDKAALREQLGFLTKSDASQIVRLKERFVEHFVDEIVLNEKVVSKLYNQVEKGGRAVLVSNANRSRALNLLNHHGLLEYFSALFFGGEKGGFANKYQYALSQLCIDAEQLCVFDDDRAELSNAINLGIHNFVWVR